MNEQLGKIRGKGSNKRALAMRDINARRATFMDGAVHRNVLFHTFTDSGAYDATHMVTVPTRAAA